MKLVSWNVNGLRSFPSFQSKLSELDGDIVCVQETRLSGASDPELEPLALIPGYSAYFSFCGVRGGYSGVATYVRNGPLTPLSAGQGLSDATGGAAPAFDNFPEICQRLFAAAKQGEQEHHDPGDDDDSIGDAFAVTVDTFEQILLEGRVVITDHDRFVLINLYAPAESVAGRGVFKIQFLIALQMKILALQRKGRSVVVAGDFNICPSPLDMAEQIPMSLFSAWHNSPKRVWLRNMLSSAGCNLVDSFRELNPDVRDAFTCWSQVTRARENNFGARIDLILVERTLYRYEVRAAEVLVDVQGSDHCPVSVVMKNAMYLDSSLIRDPPKFCAKNLPRFVKKQSKLFFRPVAGRLKRSAPFEGRSALSAIDTLLPSSSTGCVNDSEGNSQKRKCSSGPHRSTSMSIGPRKQQKIESFFINRSRRASGNRSQGALLVSAELPKGAVPENGDESMDVSLSKRGSEGETMDVGIDQERSPIAAKANAKAKWGLLFEAPPSAPKCRHGDPCKLKRVGKAGPNKGRTFWSCSRAAGRKGDRDANCNFFQWAPFMANKPLPD